jgi:hypothetical protein
MKATPYNASGKSFPGKGTYLVRITIPGTGQVIEAYFGLKQ